MGNEMKKFLVILLVLSIILGTFSFSFATGPFGAIGNALDNILNSIGKSLQELIQYAVNKFKDVNASDWFINTVSKLVGLGGIDGYPDGTFRPDATITRGEFTKLLVSTLGYKNVPKTCTHWASGYVSKAEEIGLVDKNELRYLDSPISRNEIAKMCANALDFLGETHDTDRNVYRTQIKDFNSIPVKYQNYVIKAYAKGIITGYPDGTFKGSNGLTRAEASTVVIRVIDKSERKVPKKPSTDITEYGLNVDLRKIPLYSNAQIEIRGPKGPDNPYDVDFSVIFKMWEPLEPQHKDAENLLTARFGKNNSTVKEIMNYIKQKDERKDELPYKEWTINGQLIAVVSYPNAVNKSLTVWRAK